MLYCFYPLCPAHVYLLSGLRYLSYRLLMWIDKRGEHLAYIGLSLEAGRSMQVKAACLASGSGVGEIVVGKKKKKKRHYDPVLFLLSGKLEGTNFPFFLYLLDYLFTLLYVPSPFNAVPSTHYGPDSPGRICRGERRRRKH